MTVILFLLDNSASMNQRTHVGTTVLDVAKGSIETFMKSRSRDPSSRGDRYMLLTFDEKNNVKAGWKETSSVLQMELRNIKATGKTTMGVALKSAFDLLNTWRMQNNLENYGNGRNPCAIESALILVLTDGGAIIQNDVVQDLHISMNNAVPGSELTKEPFRWDQRVFSIVIQYPGSIPPDATEYPQIPNADFASIDSMCVATAGRSYCVYNKDMLQAALDSLCVKVQNGVVVQFEKTGSDPVDSGRPDNGENGNLKENQDSNRLLTASDSNSNNSLDKKFPGPGAGPSGGGGQNWHSCRRMILVSRSMAKGQAQCHWPIPESFFPDVNSPTLPPRTAHPLIYFSCTPCTPVMTERIPFDKYELEPSPLTQYILERRQPNVCWQVFVPNSGRSQNDMIPFGYLKASSTQATVNLFVMPYNYPVILPLLASFSTNSVQEQWNNTFRIYINALPGYYIPYLKKVLHSIGARQWLNDFPETFLSYSVITYLKKLRNQAKVAMDAMNARVGLPEDPNLGIQLEARIKETITHRKDFAQLLASTDGNLSLLKQRGDDDSEYRIAVRDSSMRPQCYLNAFDVPLGKLIEQLAKMKSNLLQPVQASTSYSELEEKHMMPVQMMGNYQKYLEKQVPQLRPVDNKPERTNTFGNPFKVNKQNIFIDEAEDVMLQGGALRMKQKVPDSPAPHRLNKKKPGPIPRTKSYEELTSPPASPAASPRHMPDDDTDSEDNEDVMEIVEDDNTEPKAASFYVGEMSGEESEADDTSDAGSDSDTSTTARRSVDHRHNGTVLHPHAQTNGVSDPAAKSTGSTERGGVRKRHDDKEAWLHNCRLRTAVCKHVKKPGRDFAALFHHLSAVQGSLHTRRSFIHDIVQEATRFKRSSLVSLLQDFEKSLVQSESAAQLNR